jgi:hypothetical protein
MRVYLAATVPLLARLERDGELELPVESGAAAGPAGYAVTESLRAWYVEGDEEELEYAALTAAARGSLRLLAGRPEAPRRRVVVAADVPEARVAVPADAEGEPGVIEITGPVRLVDVASLHLDEVAAEQAVAAAAEALAAADKGDGDAAFTVEAVEDYDLLWYAVQELADLV